MKLSELVFDLLNRLLNLLQILLDLPQFLMQVPSQHLVAIATLVFLNTFVRCRVRPPLFRFSPQQAQKGNVSDGRFETLLRAQVTSQT